MVGRIAQRLAHHQLPICVLAGLGRSRDAPCHVLSRRTPGDWERSTRMDRTLAVRQRARGRVRRQVGAALRPTARALGFDLEERHFYSPIPSLTDVPDAFWKEPASLGGVGLNVEQGLELLAGPLRSHIAGFSPGGGFYLENGTYEG